ncbi:LamG-like jellyroll fold domain-containing protein [Lacrimispora sp.]|uniref:LamG-like jellyroll fold domain-containing protein n=1 Tax=Lacrimispora sp. TaxID=2719234 RepID=UPI0028AC341B|nr:LamG-like jellyroll fold domain-containing protein [Lacrimispora sp.]
MSKRALKRLATCICFALCIVLLGHMNVFADETKPVHEYNFDRDIRKVVIDSGSQVRDGLSNGKNYETLYTGYNGKGKARYLNGTDDELQLCTSIPLGVKSIRFKMKKDASTVSDKLETILSTASKNVAGGYFIGIGSEMLNHRGGIYPDLSARTGTLYIVSYHGDSALNYEIQTPKSVCDGQWHDILLTWDGSTNTNSVKLYLDDMANPAAQATAKYTTDTNTYNMPLLAGTFPGQLVINNKDEKLRYNGFLDDVQIYDTVITPSSDTSSNLKATGGNSKVDLKWNEVTGATSYTVKRSATAGGPYTTIATGVTGTTYTDTEVTNGTTYYYVVTAIINGSEGWNSNEASATPQASTDPNQPTDNKALLVISMVTGERKEYVMTADKINDFIAWYNSKAASSPTYMIEKDYNKASFTARKDYIAYEQVSNFEVNEYNN